MPTLGPIQSQIYVNPLLSNISIAYQNPSYISDRVFPEVQVPKRTGIYFTYDKSKFHVVNDLRAPSTRANRVEYGLTQTTYGPLVEHSLEQDIPDEVREEAMAPLQPDQDATNNLTERLFISKEVDAFNQLNSTSTLTQNVTLSGTSQWSDFANSDPISDLRTAVDTVKQSIMKPGTAMTLVLGYQVYVKLLNHPAIIDRIKYSQLGVTTTQLMAQIFGVREVLIAEAEQNTANENQTDAMGYVWGKNAWILYSTQAPAIREVSFGYTLRMGARKVTTWREEQVGADFCRVTDYYQQYIVAAVAAYFLKNAVA